MVIVFLVIVGLWLREVMVVVMIGLWSVVVPACLSEVGGSRHPCQNSS